MSQELLEEMSKWGLESSRNQPHLDLKGQDPWKVVSKCPFQRSVVSRANFQSCAEEVRFWTYSASINLPQESWQIRFFFCHVKHYQQTFKGMRDVTSITLALFTPAPPVARVCKNINSRSNTPRCIVSQLAMLGLHWAWNLFCKNTRSQISHANKEGTVTKTTLLTVCVSCALQCTFTWVRSVTFVKCLTMCESRELILHSNLTKLWTPLQHKKLFRTFFSSLGHRARWVSRSKTCKNIDKHFTFQTAWLPASGVLVRRLRLTQRHRRIECQVLNFTHFHTETVLPVTARILPQSQAIAR